MQGYYSVTESQFFYRGAKRRRRRCLRADKAQRTTKVQELQMVFGEHISGIADAARLLLPRRCEER